MALRLAQSLPAECLSMIAPPIAHFDFSLTRAPNCRWWVVQGDADDDVDPVGAIAWIEPLQPRPHLVVMPGAGHFFHGRLLELQDTVIEAVRSG